MARITTKDLTESIANALQYISYYHSPDFVKAMARIKEVAQSLNIPGGVHVIEPEFNQLKERIDEGYAFIAYSLDIRMLDNNCRMALNRIKD